MTAAAETSGGARPLRIAVVAAEASGDTLGAGLIAELAKRTGAIESFGMTGPGMRAVGCESWHSIDEVSVMGIAEVLPHLRRLLRLRRSLADRIIAARPDVFVGIDSPQFNLPIAAAVKAAGIPAIQYVSPQVWAWRQSRVAGIRDAVNSVLCVLPFETRFYAEHGVDAQFVGHPLADAIPMEPDRAAARARLQIDPGRAVLAVLPGSRRSEIQKLARIFLQAAALAAQHRNDLEVVVALANDPARRAVKAALQGIPLRAMLVERKAHDVFAASDVVLTASGTAALEAMLFKRKMVVAYRMSPLSYWLVRRLGVARLRNISLPNLLAEHQLMPEFVQRQVTPLNLSRAVLDVLDGKRVAPDWEAQFTRIHASLRCEGSARAAEAVLSWCRGAA